jgi:SAM-dependent methyltransferase
VNEFLPGDAVSPDSQSGDRRRLTDEEARVKAVYQRLATPQNAGRYTYFDPANLLLIHNLEWQVLRLFHRQGILSLAAAQILEIGCGSGFWLRQFVQWGAAPENLTGIDVLADCVADARHRCPETVQVSCANAAALAFPNATFDIVLQSTVFSSILDDGIASEVAREMMRVLKPDGFVLWYDLCMDNPRNPDVRGIGRRDVHHLFPGCRVELKRITLAPPLARMLAPYSISLCRLLRAVPLLCTHYLGTIHKR